MDDARDLEALARLLYGENRNITLPEAEGMGDAVLNRTQLEGYPEDIQGVLSQPNQFHPFSPKNDPRSLANSARTREFGPDHPRWPEFIAYAQHILNPERKRSPYTHYFSGEVTPPWATKLGKLTQLGSHRFGVEKRKKKEKKP